MTRSTQRTRLVCGKEPAGAFSTTLGTWGWACQSSVVKSPSGASRTRVSLLVLAAVTEAASASAIASSSPASLPAAIAEPKPSLSKEVWAF
jgi:hypothetical protein